MIKIALLNLLRKKKNVFYIISISATVGILLLLIQTKYILDQVYIEKIENNIKNRTLYVSDDTKINLEGTLNKNYIVEIKYLDGENSCLVVIDKYSNIDSAIESLKEYYNCNIYDTSGLHDIKVYNIVSIMVSAFLVILTFFAYTLIMLVINNIIDGEKRDIAIFKATGYTNKHIRQILFFRIAIISMISYFIRSNDGNNTTKYRKKNITK